MGYAAQSTGQWVNWSSSLAPTGFSSLTTQIAYYKDDGNKVDFWCFIQGTSNANSFTFSLPFALNSVYTAGGFMELAHVLNNSLNVVGRYYASGSGSIVTVEVLAGTAFTGTKGIRCTFSYQK